MPEKKEDLLFVDDLEQQARELCEKEHACTDQSDHDCGDWLTYSELERQEARRKVAETL